MNPLTGMSSALNVWQWTSTTVTSAPGRPPVAAACRRATRRTVSAATLANRRGDPEERSKRRDESDEVGTVEMARHPERDRAEDDCDRDDHEAPMSHGEPNDERGLRCREDLDSLLTAPRAICDLKRHVGLLLVRREHEGVIVVPQA